MASQSSSMSNMDCSDIFQHVLSHSSSSSQQQSSSSYHHPTPPQIQILQFPSSSSSSSKSSDDDSMYLIMSYTASICAIQIMTRKRKSQTMTIWESSAHDDDDEFMDELKSAACVLEPASSTTPSPSDDTSIRASVVTGTNMGAISIIPIIISPSSISFRSLDPFNPMTRQQQASSPDETPRKSSNDENSPSSPPPRCPVTISSFPHAPFIYLSYSSGIMYRLEHSHIFSPSSPSTPPHRLSLPSSHSSPNTSNRLIQPLPTSHPSLFSLANGDGESNDVIVSNGDGNETIGYYSTRINHNKMFFSDVGSKRNALFYDSIVENISLMKGYLFSTTTTPVKAVRKGWSWFSGTDRSPNDTLPTSYPLSSTPLTPHVTLRDPPRRILSLTLSPSSHLLALSDSLGRVTLVDLSSGQIIRMWKGVREAHCYFTTRNKRKELYLLIHARQRRVLEIWKMRHGGKVMSLGVGMGGRVCQFTDGEGEERCVIISPPPQYSISPIIIPPLNHHHPAPTTTPNPTQTPTPLTTTTPTTTTPPPPPPPSSTSHLQLQLLKQLISTDSSCSHHSPPDPSSLFNAFTAITSLVDLSVALDYLMTVNFVDGDDGGGSVGSGGSGFHARAVEYCEERLRVVEEVGVGVGRRGVGGGGGVGEDVGVLRRNIRFHSKVVAAHNILHKFEYHRISSPSNPHLSSPSDSSNDDDDDDDEYACALDSTAPRSPWARESLTWIDTYEKVTGYHVDDDQSLMSGSGCSGGGAEKRVKKKVGGRVMLKGLSFREFAKACEMETTKGSKGGGGKVVFVDSTKVRRGVLMHVFRPLLKDIFVFKVVNSIFERMGIQEDHDRLQQYFGEWFMTLPTRQAAKSSLFSTWCPILRWLQEIIISQLNTTPQQSSQPLPLILSSLYEFITQSPHLPKAFLLASICHEAVLITTKQLETKTYGMIQQQIAISPWSHLLRQLRSLLLLSLRLYHHTVDLMSVTQAPFTVANVAENQFSIYRFVALDQLDVSRKHDEIAALELACRVSGKGFNPCSNEGDGAMRVDAVQKSCINKQRNLSPLLLYFSQFNDASLLACHRVLLLGEIWGARPGELRLLEDALGMVKGLGGREEGRSVVLELWQVRVRPVVRALLFGFEDVVEVTEAVVGPLCEDREWLERLTKIANHILNLLSKSTTPQTSPPTSVTTKSTTPSSTFPPNTPDVILSSLIAKSYPLNVRSLNLHSAIIQLIPLTPSLPSLTQHLLPPDADPFLQHSLFNAPPPFPPSSSSSSQSLLLPTLLSALHTKATLTKGPIIDRFDDNLLSTLSSTYSIPLRTLRSHHLLQMYICKKDAMVDDLLSSSQQLLDIPTFIEGGFDVVCVRLDDTMTSLKTVKRFKSFIGVLDADTCQWVKDRSERVRAGDSCCFVRVKKKRGAKKKNRRWSASGGKGGHDDDEEEEKDVSLTATHVFILKLMRMSQTGNDKEAREKAHALSVLSGMLLKVMMDVLDKK